MIQVSSRALPPPSTSIPRSKDGDPVTAAWRIHCKTSVLECTMTADNENQRERQSHQATAVRLPCRGCLPGCADFATCEGRPWRAPGEGTDEARSLRD